MSVLVVEDDASLARLFSALLRTEGFNVLISDDGAKGLEVLEQIRPDAIILDLSMPVMDGKTFFRKAREGGYDGPIMICSAYGARTAQQELGAEASIPKPFNPEVLVATLRGLL